MSTLVCIPVSQLASSVLILGVPRSLQATVYIATALADVKALSLLIVHIMACYYRPHFIEELFDYMCI